MSDPDLDRATARKIDSAPGAARTRWFHLCLDVRGALMNWTDREMRGVFKHDDGRPMSAREAKEFLMDEIAKGHKVIPCVDDCEGFDYQTGCPGHDKPTAPAEPPTTAEQKGPKP